MRKPPLLLLALTAGVLAVSACGVRVDDSLRQQAASAQLGTGGGGGGVSGDGTGAGDGTGGASTGSNGTEPAAGGTDRSGADPVAGGTDSPAGGAATGATDAGTAPATGTDKPAAGGGGGAPAPAPAGGNGGAVDIGVTANSITVGTVADLSGPVPGLFQGAVFGTQAYFAMINSQGGVFGRKINVKVGDSQLDCGANKSQHQKLSKQVYAFVGSYSLFDDCGADVLKGSGIPDLHSTLGQKAAGLPNNFNIAPLPPGWRTGPLKYYQGKYGDKFNKIGSIYADAGGTAATWFGTRSAIESIGGKVLYAQPFRPTDTDFTADIVRMRNAGVQMVYITASDAPSFARMVKSIRSQNVDWPIIAGGIAYDSSFLKTAGADAEGVFNDAQFAQFFNADDAAAIPAVKTYQTWYDRVAPGKKKDLFSIFGWTEAQLFVDALKAAGPKATRADLIAQLQKVTKFDGNGLLAPANPAGKKPATCWLLSQVKAGKFVRVETPGSTFRCDGSYFNKK